MLLYRRLHEMILLILLLGLINLYDIIKNVNIALIGEVIYINEKNIIYLLLITLFFFFIFLHSNFFSSSKFSLLNSMEFELILGLGFIGLFFFIISNDFILFFLALELYSLSVYLLLFKNEINLARISILYFLIGSISSSFILLGFSILYTLTGSLDINYIIENLNTIIEYHNLSFFGFNPISIGFAFFFIGLLFKIGAAPFQFWVIRVYTQMDLKILIYQSIIPKIAYIYIISNIINKFEKNTIIALLLFLLFSSALFSLFLGPIGGITHGVNKFKTIIAYSSILHVGYLLLGIVSNYYSGAIYLNIFQYLLIYGLNTLQFLIALYFLQNIYNNNKNINIRLLFFFFLISVFSFIGLPPFAGFYGKINIIFNCFLTNNLLFQLFAILFILISTLIALFLYLKFIKYLYFLPKEGFISVTETENSYFFSYLLSFLTFFLFFYPFFFPYISPIFELLSL